METEQISLEGYVEDLSFGVMLVKATDIQGTIKAGEEYTAVRKYTAKDRPSIYKLKDSLWNAHYGYAPNFTQI